MGWGVLYLDISLHHSTPYWMLNRTNKLTPMITNDNEEKSQRFKPKCVKEDLTRDRNKEVLVAWMANFFIVCQCYALSLSNDATGVFVHGV